MTAALPATRADRGLLPTSDAPTASLGLMVCDQRGRVVAANSRLKEIVSPHGWDQSAKCCTLLGCGHASGPLEGACLTERSLAAGERLEEVRLRPARKTPLVVTATPLCDGGSQVLFEVRPDPGASDTAPPLRIFALGAMQLESSSGPLAGEWLAQRPGELLRFLVCERWRIVPADVIGEAIWPHAGTAAPNTVRHFVHALRDRLEPGRSASAARNSTVVCRAGGYGLDMKRVWVDVDEFERQAVAGVSALQSGRRVAAREHLERAIALYRGDFLSDEPYAEWALRERDRLRAVASEVLRALVDLSNLPDGVSYLEQLAELEPFDDDVHRDLVAAWLSMGRRSRAARHYESFRVRLMREFGELPGFELSGLTESRRCA